jgi:hypothetical protein
VFGKNQKDDKELKYANQNLWLNFEEIFVNSNIPNEKWSEEIVSIAMITSRYKIVLGSKHGIVHEVNSYDFKDHVCYDTKNDSPIISLQKLKTSFLLYMKMEKFRK